jgi:hypothetical protein
VLGAGCRNPHRKDDLHGNQPTRRRGHASGQRAEPRDHAGRAAGRRQWRRRAAKADIAVDLAAWARGREYPFGEVQKAIDDYAVIEIQKMIDARFSGITDRRKAVQFLIAEGIIDADEARTDV